MKANIKHHNPDPNYIRRLIDCRGLTVCEAAETIGISYKCLYNYIDPKSSRQAPYCIQYALENIELVDKPL